MRALVHCWWECKISRITLETCLEFLVKLTTGLSYDPVILLLDSYPREMSAHVHKACYTRNVHSSCIHDNPKLKNPMSTSKRMDKLWDIQTTEYYLVKRIKLIHRTT